MNIFLCLLLLWTCLLLQFVAGINFGTYPFGTSIDFYFYFIFYFLFFLAISTSLVLILDSFLTLSNQPGTGGIGFFFFNTFKPAWYWY